MNSSLNIQKGQEGFGKRLNSSLYIKKGSRRVWEKVRKDKQELMALTALMVLKDKKDKQELTGLMAHLTLLQRF